MAGFGVAVAFAAFLALASCGALAARVPASVLSELHSEGLPSGFRTVGATLQEIVRDAPRRGPLRKHKGGDEELHDTHIAVVRFTVPPSCAKDFEDAWFDLEKRTVKAEKHNQVFDLKKTKLDNVFYTAYGEWEEHDDVMDHFESKHFKDFAEFVDDAGIRWELQLLKDMSQEVEEKQGTKRMADADLTKRKDMAHVLFYYIVRPGQDQEFVDRWTKTAYSTIEEDGNRMYSLRKTASDNTRFYGYGVWDSMRDYLDHLGSGHVGDLIDFARDNDVVWFIAPLEKLGHERE